jgi:hypothetical protein
MMAKARSSSVRRFVVSGLLPAKISLYLGLQSAHAADVPGRDQEECEDGNEDHGQALDKKKDSL